VKPQFRNRGVGTLLMNQLMYEVAGLYPQMSLCVRSSNPVVSLYTRLGFTEIKDTRRTTQDRDLEVFTMLKVFTTEERKNKFL
jgi:ribosomal protein S18 acetylase RimI-like enzyme